MNAKEKATKYVKSLINKRNGKIGTYNEIVSFVVDSYQSAFDVAIKEAKIEMCNEIIGKIDHKHEDNWTADDYIELIEQQIRHLSNSSNTKALSLNKSLAETSAEVSQIPKSELR